jgi:hypothetical protein
MLVDNRDHERPSNITGLSLVLFLFLSLLSMMAAYEVNKPTDDLRGNVIASFHEYTTQAADAETSDHLALAEARRNALPHFLTEPAHPAALTLHFASASRAFDARGPPEDSPAAS